MPGLAFHVELVLYTVSALAFPMFPVIAVTEVSQPARRRRSELIIAKEKMHNMCFRFHENNSQRNGFGTTTAMTDGEIRNTISIYYSKLRCMRKYGRKAIE